MLNSKSPAQHYHAFIQGLSEKNPDLYAGYQNLENLQVIEKSQVLIAIAIEIEDYIARFIDVGSLNQLKSILSKEKQLITAKADYIKKAQIRRRNVPVLEIEQEEEKLQGLLAMAGIESSGDKEYDFAFLINTIKNDEEKKEDLQKAEDIYFSMKNKGQVQNWISEFAGQKLDYDHLEKADYEQVHGTIKYTAKHYRKRDGFALTDRRGTRREVTKHIDYCMICHERDKDSCSKGIKEKDGAYKKNPLGIESKGCPLDEKISEMHYLRREGYPIAALAMVMLDNPMCAGTGHRICNDCMKGCIFQKQEPVNIPKVETSVLSDILQLPQGLELYEFLMVWNPLNKKRPFALPYNGKKILVVGLGPAGYTLSHYLLNEGFGVVAIDGLKIESALDIYGLSKEGQLPAYKDAIEKELDQRIISGFGGVSEYGITSRWDKNFLTVLQLLLERRSGFKILDGIRFGGTITVEDAWDLGFSHIALATGAGKPTLINVKNNLSRGVRKASDFLMALQLTGAARKDSMSNLQVQLPAIVIGGGLTAIDTATETLAYYPVQVEKFWEQARILIENHGYEQYRAMFDEEEWQIASRFEEHGKAISECRKKAEEKGMIPDFLPLLREWGGVKLIYRRKLQNSPAYRLNHEEINEALEEGIEIIEDMNPIGFLLDPFGCVEAVEFALQNENAEQEKCILSARTVFVAAGTAPNTTYEKEYPSTFQMDKKTGYYTCYRAVEEA
jgi:NADPH-dependent glutamate synthase beta subunit-like oxidoreductase